MNTLCVTYTLRKSIHTRVRRRMLARHRRSSGLGVQVRFVQASVCVHARLNCERIHAHTIEKWYTSSHYAFRTLTKSETENIVVKSTECSALNILCRSTTHIRDIFTFAQTSCDHFTNEHAQLDHGTREPHPFDSTLRWFIDSSCDSD